MIRKFWTTLGIIAVLGICEAQILQILDDGTVIDPLCYKQKIRCPSHFTCAQGKCVPNCQFHECEVGYRCNQANWCEEDPDYCHSDDQCQDGKICYFDGECIDECSIVSCPLHQVCKQGKCVDREICKDAQQDVRTVVKTCDGPRFYNYECEASTTNNAKFCGITNSGDRINFATECQACNNFDVQFYMNEPCHKAPFICESDEVCKDQYCSGECWTDCPFNWQLCISGTCVDQCKFMDCEGCKYGTCKYNENYRTCKTDYECFNNGLSCVNNVCTDLCTHTRCGHKQTCLKGQCYPSISQ